MNRETLTEEERRRRRNEASRRCYLKRKAELAAQAQPVGAKNKKPKAKAVEAKPARRGPDPVVAAERLCKTYARVAGGIKPMIKDAAEFLGIVYKSEDQRVVEKVERILAKGLGVGVSRLASDPMEKTRVCLDAVSKAVKTPKFRLIDVEHEEAKLMKAVAPESEEPVEIPTDPETIEKIENGTVDKSEIRVPDKDDLDDEDLDDDDVDDEDEDDVDDEDDEDDEDDDSEEAEERRRRRREREDLDNAGEYETGRWEMMGEMGAQGAFDD